jgi:hypothetical protein
VTAAVVRPLLPALLAVACLAAPAAAGELGRVFRGLAAPLKAVHRQPPPPGIDPCVEDLAARIAWLESHIDAYGSIVAKQPDVWGQSRLTRYRVEYEEQMRRQLGMFSVQTTASIRRSDQAFLGMALAVQSASGRRRRADEVPVPEVATGNSVITSIQGLLPTTNEAAGRADPVVIARTAPFAAVPDPAALPFDAEPLGLEPTIHLDQMSRYLDHLAQLRRINEGDDSADSPGYALNLIRIPVSILPGKHTRKGHGAEITVTAEPLLGEDLLPVTFRSLVINDLVDMIAPALTWCVNDPECVAWAATITGAATEAAAPAAARQGLMAALEGLRAKLPTIAPTAPTGVKTRRSRLPLPFTQLADVAGTEQIAILIRDTRAALAAHPANDPCIGYMDVRGHLAEELEAAWDFLALDARRHAWDELPAWNLAALVRGRQVRDVAAIRCRFFASVGAGGEPGPELLPALPGHDQGDTGACCAVEPSVPPLCRTTTAVLAWGILVESALLDERLAADLREAATARGHAAPAAPRPAPFYGPHPGPEARAAFADYVRCRWPIRIFALDPVSDDQNVDDAHARRRELQIAMATAAATGRLSAQAMARFTRRLEQDMAVVALNRTAVGFSHGSDTFGWRFYPRVQTPPTRGGLAALGETVCGPTSDGDLAQRQLEPGQRECTAIVVMPAFVPWVTLDVRTNWFALAHPKATDPGIQHTLVLSRAVKAMQSSAVACGRCAHHYRDGEIPRLLRRVDQLERELPLQTLQAQIPQENTAGGFELFNVGVTDLAPELLGWYGAPGIDPAAATSLFLVGRGFSVHDTAVIAGGRPARFRLLSREVLRVDVPAGAATIVPPACPPDAAVAVRRSGLQLASAAEPLPAPAAAACDRCGPAADGCRPDCNRREVVDIHLATPYGVSSHLLVPVSSRGGGAAHGLAFDPPCTLGLTFAATKTTAAPAAKVDEFFTASCDAIAIAAPETFIPPGKAALRLVLRDAATGTTAATFSFPEPFFDARHSRYLIAGGDLRNFVGDTSRPATDKTLRGAVKPYLDSLLQQGLLSTEGDAVALALTADLVAGEHEVPVGGAVTVTVTRRGVTVEPPTEPAATAP